MTPDVNVLVAASRAEHPQHRIATAWLNAALSDCTNGGVMRLMPMVVASFLRLVTNSKIFVQPTPITDAVAFVDAMLAIPGVDMPSIGAEWAIFRQLCIEKNLAANDVPDAWLAASVVRLGEHLVTFDVDFKKLLKRTQLTVLAPA